MEQELKNIEEWLKPEDPISKLENYSWWKDFFDGKTEPEEYKIK